jgi:hypothetical protein
VDIQNQSFKLDVSTAGQNASIIAVGGEYYISADGGQTYTPAPPESGASFESSFQGFNNMWQDMTPAEIDRAGDKLKDGSPPTETIDGDPTKHMTADMADLSTLGSGSTGATEGTIDIWVTTDNPNFVRQMVIDGTSGGQTVQGTMKWSDFNQNLNITAP